jgi:hypothetical protein
MCHAEPVEALCGRKIFSMFTENSGDRCVKNLTAKK